MSLASPYQRSAGGDPASPSPRQEPDMGERLGELAAIGVVPPDLLERRAVGKRVIDRLVGIAHYVERVFINDLVTQVGWLARFFWRSHVPSLPERAGARPERGFAYGLGMG